MADQELIAASQRGDVAAFNQLVGLYQQRIYNLAYRMLGDADSAADATQETFLSAYQNIGRLRGGSFSGWLLRIASNACYDELRRRQRRPTASLDQMVDDGAFPHPADAGPTPEQWTLNQELQRQLQRGLNQLPADQRMAVVLCDVQAMSYEEIAAVTRSSLGTVKSRISRGRAHLRDFLVQEGELSPDALRHE